MARVAVLFMEYGTHQLTAGWRLCCQLSYGVISFSAWDLQAAADALGELEEAKERLSMAHGVNEEQQEEVHPIPLAPIKTVLDLSAVQVPQELRQTDKSTSVSA